MRHEEKEGKLSDFLCSHSNAVLVRSRSHYLCIRKNLSARRPSRVNIQIKKWTQHHRSPNIKVRFGRVLHECSLTSLNACGFSPPMKGMYKKNNNSDKGLGWAKEGSVRQLRGVHKTALLHDDEEVPATAFKMKWLPQSMVLREMLQEITFDYKKRILLDV